MRTVLFVLSALLFVTMGLAGETQNQPPTTEGQQPASAPENTQPIPAPMSGPGTLRPVIGKIVHTDATIVLVVQVQLQPTRQALAAFINDAFDHQRAYPCQLIDQLTIPLKKWWQETADKDRYSKSAVELLNKVLPTSPTWVRRVQVGVIIIRPVEEPPTPVVEPTA